MISENTRQNAPALRYSRPAGRRMHRQRHASAAGAAAASARRLLPLSAPWVICRKAAALHCRIVAYTAARRARQAARSALRSAQSSSDAATAISSAAVRSRITVTYSMLAAVMMLIRQRYC